jgi:hypothetical protein
MNLGFYLLTLKTFKSYVVFTPRPVVMQLKTATKKPHHRECAFTSGTGTNPLMPCKTQFNSRHGTISRPISAQINTQLEWVFADSSDKKRETTSGGSLLSIYARDFERGRIRKS